MSQDSLTARYRPQNFAAVAGQEAVKSILSRAASTGRVAPAYLFSGTRGVGKTTLARIFAKALNCVNGPAAEPCNQCPICRQITQGAAVDVVEIDGASNTGVDNVRRLKEDVGYAPLECRFKVIIIDEAHMLSKAAFNALLKTLEEPPGHVTFIMATTEPEKFPQTIISRCQHFVFKRLPQAELAAHLHRVLEAEGIAAEPSAVNLIARRGAGSVRDCMSLLGQVLALGAGDLRLHDVREVLGLAGQEVFVRLAECVHGRDLLGLNALLTEVLDQGVDLGFFLRELGACWRNLFLLAQLGDGARGIIDLPAEDVDAWAALAPGFALPHLHAAWQMTMDSQRKILTSTEPALALELLLVNLACLPDLLAVGAGQSATRPAPATPSRAPMPSRPVAPRSAPTGGIPTSMAAPSRSETPSRPVPPVQPVAPAHPVDSAQTATPAQPAAQIRPDGGPAHSPSPVEPPRVQAVREPGAEFTARSAPATSVHAGPSAASRPVSDATPRTWAGFVRFCASAETPRPLPKLDQVQGQVQGGELVLTSSMAYLCDRLRANLPTLTDLARRYYGADIAVRVDTSDAPVRKTRAELRDEAAKDSVITTVQTKFQARIMEVRPVPNGNTKETEI